MSKDTVSRLCREAEEPEMTGVIDLMDRLKESLEGKPKKSASSSRKKSSLVDRSSRRM